MFSNDGSLRQVPGFGQKKKLEAETKNKGFTKFANGQPPLEEIDTFRYGLR